MPAAASIPVVVVTGDGRAEEKATRLGAAGYLRKPLEIHTLLTTVAKHIARS
jgi:CheY-like chemotaxis protein